MDKKIIIGFGGKAGSGKDRIADSLCEKLIEKGYSANRVGYADVLKEALNPVFKYFGLTAKDKTKVVYSDKTVRQTLQEYGEHFKDFFGQDFWRDIIQNKMEASDAQFQIISDVRFARDIEKIKESNGILYYIKRNIKEIKQNTHISEVSLTDKDFDMVIDNNTSLEAAVSMIFKDLSSRGIL